MITLFLRVFFFFSFSFSYQFRFRMLALRLCLQKRETSSKFLASCKDVLWAFVLISKLTLFVSLFVCLFAYSIFFFICLFVPLLNFVRSFVCLSVATIFFQVYCISLQIESPHKLQDHINCRTVYRLLSQTRHNRRSFEGMSPPPPPIINYQNLGSLKRYFQHFSWKFFFMKYLVQTYFQILG